MNEVGLFGIPLVSITGQPERCPSCDMVLPLEDPTNLEESAESFNEGSTKIFLDRCHGCGYKFCYRHTMGAVSIDE